MIREQRMTKKTRRKHSAEFKAKVVLAAMVGAGVSESGAD